MSGCNSESANVEHFIDYHLQPIAISIPSFLRDSLHFKSLLSDLNIRDSDILFSLSMSNLFTPTYLFNKALPPSNKHSLNTLQQQRIDKTNLFLLYSNSRYSATISSLIIKHTYKPKAPQWAKNRLTFSSITLFLLPKTHVATRATAFARFIALCAHTFLLSTWAKPRIAFDPDSHNTNTTSPHTTKYSRV